MDRRLPAIVSAVATALVISLIAQAQPVPTSIGIQGSGTANTIPKFTGLRSVGNSSITDNGTTVSTTENLTVGGFTQVGDLRGTVQTYTTPTGAQTVTLSATTTLLRFNASSTIDLVGLTGGADVRVVILQNISTTNNVNIFHENAGATAANRFVLDSLGSGILVNAGGGNAGGMAVAHYDASVSRWRVAWLLGNNTPGSVTVNGSLSTTGNFTASSGNSTLGGLKLTQIDASSISGTTNNWDPQGAGGQFFTTVRATSSAAATVTGIINGSTGKRITILNIGANDITFDPENGSSTASNRLRTAGSVAWTLQGWSATNGVDSITFEYDGTLSRWAMVGHSGKLLPNTVVNGTLDATGVTTLSSTLTVSGNATFNGSANTFGDSTTDLTTFSNGPQGINSYAGTHLEWNDDWMGAHSGGTSTTTQVGTAGYLFQVSGAGSRMTNPTGVTQRPGIVEVSTGTTAAGISAVTTGENAINFGDGNWTWESTLGYPTLSSATDGYLSVIGFFDGWNLGNQTDGCYFVYDERNALAGNKNPTNLQKFECWCASNSTRTGYLMDGTTVSDGSFTTVNAPVAALTYPNTNIYRLKIKMTGSSQAEFFVNGTKSCNITTNIPTGSVRLEGAGWNIAKSAGTAERFIDVDQTRLDVVLTSARSP